MKEYVQLKAKLPATFLSIPYDINAARHANNKSISSIKATKPIEATFSCELVPLQEESYR